MIVTVIAMIAANLKVAVEVEVEIEKKIADRENLILNRKVKEEVVLEIMIVIVILDRPTQVHKIFNIIHKINNFIKHKNLK